MSEIKTPAQVLRAAADHVEKVGLHKGGFFPRETNLPVAERPCCALGAIGVASGYFVDAPGGGYRSIYAATAYDSGGYADAVAAVDSAAADALQEHLAMDSAEILAVPMWSDSEDTTAADVAAAMRKAAERML